MSNYIWDVCEGGILFHGTGELPIPEGPAEEGDTVRLLAEDFEFDVLVTSIDAGGISGVVRTIGPVPSLEELGIERGDTVSFDNEHVFQIWRG